MRRRDAGKVVQETWLRRQSGGGVFIDAVVSALRGTKVRDIKLYTHRKRTVVYGEAGFRTGEGR